MSACTMNENDSTSGSSASSQPDDAGSNGNPRRKGTRRPHSSLVGFVFFLVGLIVALVCVLTFRDNKDEKSRPALPPTEQPKTLSPTKSPVRATDRPTLAPSLRPTASPLAPTTSKQNEVSASPKRPESGETMRLPKNIRSATLAGSDDGEILLLEMLLETKDAIAGRASGVDTDESQLIRIPAGRSYDGGDWEAVPPTHLSYDCTTVSVLVDGKTKFKCRVDLPPMYDDALVMYYTVRSIVVDPSSTTAEEKAARFLIQTTFGPTESEVADIVDNNILPEQWIRMQMDETKTPPSLHREHYRRRANQRVRPGAGVGSTGTFGIRSPCDAGSRWNRFAFTDLDIGKEISAELLPEENRILLKVDGRPRTEVQSYSLPKEVVICSVEEYVGGNIVVGAKNAENLCRRDSTGTIPNPAVAFSDETAARYNIVDASLVDTEPRVTDTGILGRSMSIEDDDGLCPLSGPGPFFVRASNSLDRDQDLRSSIYIHDPRGQLFDATPGSVDVPPQIALASSIRQCTTIPKTFLNEGSCQPMRGDCSGNSYGTGKKITLNDETIRRFYELDGRYVYVVKGLPVEGTRSPCMPVKGKRQRWVRYGADNDEQGCPGGGETDLSVDVLTALRADIRSELLNRDSAARSSVLAIDVAHKERCNDHGAAIGATVRLGNLGCWTHSNPGEYGVYDASWWVFSHPGNSPRHRRFLTNPIAHIAEADRKKNLTESITLTFPSWHPSERWKHWLWAQKQLGGYGDVVDFARLPPEVQGPAMAQHLGVAATGNVDDAFEFCGSPGEVANDPLAGAQYALYDEADMAKVVSTSFDQDHELEEGKSMVWTSVVFSAPDQLRQRVAFALSQIFVVSSTGLNMLQKQTEPFAAYYDIFVRNAFGLFGDILKEVSFSPLMGRYLSYLGGMSFGHNFEELGLHLYADENFAREVMQLFTIGLDLLNENGTQVLDENENAVPTYSNKDIMTLARGWTGFDTQKARSNLEASGSLRKQGQSNDIDPMRISPKEGRDAFPKLGLDYGNGESRRYMGDGLPLCSSLPPRAFLSRGATYRYLGSDPNPTMSRPDVPFHSRHRRSPRLTLSPESSSLYKVLCNAADPDGSGNNKCRFQSIVKLDENLECDGICLPTPTGGDQDTCECSIDEPRVVRLDPSSETGSKNPVYYEYVRPPCVSLAFESKEDNFSVVKEIGASGSAMCAEKLLPVGGTACCDDERSSSAESVCVFLSERVSFYTAKERCEAIGKRICNWSSLPASVRCGTTVGKREGLQFQWTNSPCRIQASVNSDGDVAVIHDVSSQNAPAMGRVNEAGATYFRVEWDGNKDYPKTSDGCSDACTVSGSKCICDIEVANGSVFIDGKFSFRNPPMYGTSLVDPSQRDGLYETDAILDHLLHHPNVAPFIATRLIQLLITSNPSPRHVQSVASAFKTGRFSMHGNNFGSGAYGDMEAAVAAIFLDPEAQSTTLTFDRTQGRAREPLLKVMHFLRSMELGANEERQINLPELRQKIGQEAHYSPSVFNFFLPSFSPIGPVLASNLVSPESQLLDPPQALSFINGITSVSKYGLSDCGDGFGSEKERFKMKDGPYEEYFACGSLKRVPYQFKWKPSQWGNADQVVKELDLVLTGGRLSSASRQLIEHVYSEAFLSDGRIEALSSIQAMIALSPEYHSTNVASDSGDSTPTSITYRDEIPSNLAPVTVGRQQETTPVSNYKAVVYLFAAGGMDSHSVLVPLDGCSVGDLHAQYKKIRSNIALSHNQLLPIDVAPGTQPCTEFGIHSSLTTVKTLFEDGDAAFLANVGSLIAPITRADYDNNDSSKIPPSLFAHNTQQRATQTLQAQNPRAHGVLGRLGDALNLQAKEETGDASEIFAAYSILGSPKALEGAPGVSRVADVLSSRGISGLSVVSRKIERYIKAMHAPRSSSIFAETFSDRVTSAIARTKELSKKLKRHGLMNGPWHLPRDSPACCSSDICMQLQQVAQIIRNRDTLDASRDAFFVQHDGYDTHNNNLPRLKSLLDELDEALLCFSEELKAQDIWDSTAIVLASDFGRSLSSNGLGTDHGWGGNYFVVGGAVKGGQVLGDYPNDLTENSPFIIEKGRVLPTAPWDAVWAGVAEWMGLNEDRIKEVLPNLSNFDREQLFTTSELFVE